MKKMNSLKLLMICFTVTLFFANCQPDSKSSSEENTTENAPSANDLAELIPVDEGAKDVKTPEQIALEEIADMPTTSIEWVDTEHDFGDIQKNEKVAHTFKFKNTGTAPLIIASAKAGCGCTVPSKPDEPILPGKMGEIKVEYNGSGNGQVTKFVDVVLNTESKKDKLTIKTNVIVPDGQ